MKILLNGLIHMSQLRWKWPWGVYSIYICTHAHVHIWPWGRTYTQIRTCLDESDLTMAISFSRYDHRFVSEQFSDGTGMYMHWWQGVCVFNKTHRSLISGVLTKLPM